MKPREEKEEDWEEEGTNSEGGKDQAIEGKASQDQTRGQGEWGSGGKGVPDDRVHRGAWSNQ